MKSKSDKNSELIVKYMGGKENWKAFIAEGGHIDCTTSAVDTFVQKMDIFQAIDEGKKEQTIRRMFGLAKGAYDRKVFQHKEFNKPE
jgi:hypothetical protein